jgi:hypothetical protein
METVIVTFPRVRTVRVDDATQGQTGQVIHVQRGVHKFDLGLPLDYTPPSVQRPVANTTPDAPLIVEFQSAAFAPPPAPPPPPAAMAPAARAGGGGVPSAARRTARRKKAGSKRKPASKKRTAPKKKGASRRKPAKRKKSGGKTR